MRASLLLLMTLNLTYRKESNINNQLNLRNLSILASLTLTQVLPENG